MCRTYLPLWHFVIYFWHLDFEHKCTFNLLDLGSIYNCLSHLLFVCMLFLVLVVAFHHNYVLQILYKCTFNHLDVGFIYDCSSQLPFVYTLFVVLVFLCYFINNDVCIQSSESKMQLFEVGIIRYYLSYALNGTTTTNTSNSKIIQDVVILSYAWISEVIQGSVIFSYAFNYFLCF